MNGLSGYSLDLTDPLWLAGLGVLPLLVWYYRRSLVDFSRGQRLASLLCRSAFVTLLVLVLAGLTLRRPSADLFVLFAVDRSESIGEEASRAIDDFLGQALTYQGDARTAFLAFAAQPGLVSADRVKGTAAPKEEDERLGTDIAAAIEVAAGAIPAGHVPRVVLLTDGNQTTGDAAAAALRAGVPLYTVPLPRRGERDVQLAKVIVPPQVREGEPFWIEVVVHSNYDDEGILDVFCGRDKLSGDQRVKVRSGEQRFKFQHTLKQGGLALVQAKLRSFFEEKRLDNNSGRGLVFCAGKPRVLIVDNDPRQADHLARALEEQGIQVDPPRPPEGLPDSLAEMQNYDLIVLSNVPATHPRMTQRVQQQLRLYVQELGGGLLFLGGEHSYGLGGYSKSQLESLLPVHCDFEKEKEKPSLAMVLVIDRSGSMEGVRIAAAKEAARGAVELLGPKDKIGVIVFDSKMEWLSELQSAANKGSILSNIDSIAAGGGTSMLPAMQAAFEGLTALGTAAKYKHVICLTDGEDGVSGPPEFLELTGRMHAAGLTVSTVAVGEADQGLLKQIAERGGGRAYVALDPASVPQIFAQETMEASRDAIQEQPFQPMVFKPTPVLANVDWAEAPLLHGYVRTRIKVTAEQPLMTNKGDPLLAWWRTGLGRCTAFTSDAKPRWADSWITDWQGGFNRFWAQVARHTMRRPEARGVELRVEPRWPRVHVTLDVVDALGQFLNEAETELVVIDPQRGQQQLAMAQTAPGRYAADFAPEPGADYLLLRVLQKHGDGALTQTRGLALGYPEELRFRPPDEALLEALARDTGGVFRPEPAAVFAPASGSETQGVPLWPYLLMAALPVFVLDVALRRLTW
jgi:Mg-chelatase subunit ChlD